MIEYDDYARANRTNEEVFRRNFGSDIAFFNGLIQQLRTAWARVGTTRDKSGRSHAGLLVFSNMLVRHAIFGFEHLACYQSYLAWLNFRPGFEAFLIIGKLLDDPKNADVWKGRETDPEAYRRMFSGRSLESKAIARSREFRSVLTRLNDEFMHPNPYFAYRESRVRQTETDVWVDIQFFDTAPEVHEAHLLAYLNLLNLVVDASEELVNALCGPAASKRVAFAVRERERASGLATRSALAKKIMEELGLWKF